MNADLILLSVKDLMNMFDCSRSTIYSMEKSGELPPRIPIGKSWKWRLIEIQEYLESRRSVFAPKRIVGKRKNVNAPNNKQLTLNTNRTSSFDERSKVTTVRFSKLTLTK